MLEGNTKDITGFDKSVYNILIAVAYNSDIDHPSLSFNLLDKYLPYRKEEKNLPFEKGVRRQLGNGATMLALGHGCSIEDFLKVCTSPPEGQLYLDDLDHVYKLTDQGLDLLTQLHYFIND